MKSFQLSQYDFELPERLIAQKPADPRDESRLLVLDVKNKSWSHHLFKDLPQFLSEGDLLVANNSKVMKARLLGHRLRHEI